MPEFIDLKANDYSKKFSEPTDSLLNEIEKFTLANHAHPHMLSGPVQGKFLELMSKIIRPYRILEIGTFTGYSALCLAKGLVDDGELHTIELRTEDANLSRRYFARSDQAGKIFIHEGNALNLIPYMRETWDLVFIDADKPNYINYYELTLPKLRSGGIIIADNVLFHGDVLEPEIKGKNAEAIHAFNTYVAEDSRVQQVLLTVRDGLMIIRKK